MLVAPFHRPLICRSTAVALALAVLATALLPGCASTSKGKRSSGPSESSGSAATTMVPSGTRQASYGVTWTSGGTSGEGSYRLAYVMKEGAPFVVETESDGFQTSSSDEAGDAVRGEKIRSYLMMSPIRAIIGTRTDFVVGETYDGIVMEGGKPLFKYTCDREEEIAGMKGLRLTVRTAKKGTPELELVLSKEYPFPLYVKEHTGQEPLQIFLKDRQ